MQTSLSKLATNQFESVTRNRFPLMSAILHDVFTHFTTAAQSKPEFQPALDEITAARAQWRDGITKIHNTEAAQLSKTLGLQEGLAKLTRKPDINTASKLESWDNIIRGITPQGSILYIKLLPHGRETLTRGSINQRIDAIQAFAIRLTKQTDHPTLVSLGSDEVSPFAGALGAMRSDHQRTKASLIHLRGEQEKIRRHVAAEIYAAVALGMRYYRNTPERVDDLFNVSLLRRNSNSIPLAPEDTLWDAATRTLGTTEMPHAATHLLAYRRATGGMPELLAEGDFKKQSVTIPSSIIFHPGETYDLWLVGKNARGTSPPGPVVVWKAP